MSSISEETPAAKIECDSSSYTVKKYDILTVFQAAPLGYQDSSSGKLFPMGMLDFDLEQETVSDAVKEAQRFDAKIDVVFETATTDRLGAFLAKGESEILHFSCHGDPEYLFVENGWGAGQVLLVKNLKEYIAAGGSSLRFVFVSACHSRSAGDAFIAAGVPHVVCCQQDSQAVRNTAAVEFARAFYRALACGKSLKNAFELGKKGVEFCPHVVDACKEVKKFALLPEKSNHDVAVFFTKPLPRAFKPKCWCPPRMFPVPPQPFVGRNVDMLRIINAIRSARIVRVTGPASTGKCSLVKAVGQYIYKRNIMEDMFWLPADQTCDGNDIVSCLSRVFHEFLSEINPASTFTRYHNRPYRDCLDVIVGELHERRALIMIDARKLGITGLTKLTTFLEDLFQRTKNTKVIIVHRNGDDIRSRSFSVVEADVELAPLDFESTVSLHACLCPHVKDYDEFYDTLVTLSEQKSLVSDHRTSVVFKMLGEGLPARINDIAKTISRADYDRITAIAKRPVPGKFKTRASLEQNLTALQEEVWQAVRLHNYRRANEIKETLDDIEVLRESLPELSTLRYMEQGIQADLDQAIFMNDFIMADKLHAELNSLKRQIQREVKDSKDSECVADDEDEYCNEKKASFAGTRAGLEGEIKFLEIALEEASDKDDYRQARIIDGKLLHLKLRRDKMPSRDELSIQIGELKIEHKELKHNRRWDCAETLHRKIVDLEKRMKREIDAEREMRSAEDASVKYENEKHSDEEKYAGAPCQSEGRKLVSRDPPGFHMTEANKAESCTSEKHPDMWPDAWSDILPRTIRNSESEFPKEEPGGAVLNHSSGASITTRPGAPKDSVIEKKDASTDSINEENDEMPEYIAPPENYRRQNYRRQNYQRPGAFAIAGGSARRRNRDDCMSELSLDTAIANDANREPLNDSRQSSPEAIISYDATLVRERDDTLDRVRDDTLDRERLFVDGVLLNAEHADRYCERKGLCRSCGVVKTHRRKRHRLLRSVEMEHITETDANGNYTVYKGYCLGPLCHTLEEARRKLGELPEQVPTQTSRRNKSRRTRHNNSNDIACNQDDEDIPTASPVHTEIDEAGMERIVTEVMSRMTTAVPATMVEAVGTRKKGPGRLFPKLLGKKSGEE